MKKLFAITLSLITISSTAFSDEYCLSSFKVNLNFGNALFDVRCNTGRKFLIEVEDSLWTQISSGPQKRQKNYTQIINQSNAILRSEGFETKSMSYIPFLQSTSILRKSLEVSDQNKNLCLVSRAKLAAPPSSISKINYNIFCGVGDNGNLIGVNVNSLIEIHNYMTTKGYTHKATLDVNEKESRANLIYQQL